VALFVRQDDNRSELQQRIAAELREKLKSQAEIENQPTDPINDEHYLEGTKKTTSLAFIWVLIAVLALVALVTFIIMLS
jgi:hypothetical protein